MNRLDLNTQKLLSTILKLSIKEGERGKISELKKNQIFKHNSASGYCCVRKCQMRRLDFNAKALFSSTSQFWNFRRWNRRKTINFEKFSFLNITRLQITPRKRILALENKT